MKTISQVASLTGISTRTLQYYDEIDLLKPSELTPSGYRLYNDEALEKLQQILFYKELNFKLNEIKEILQKPEYDKIEAFKKQKKLLSLKRSRIDKLIALLERLEKGESCMSFKEFDLSEYIEALEQFKNEKSEEVVIRQIKRCPVLHIILHHIPHVEDTSVTFQSPVLSVYFKKGFSAAN